MLESPRLILRSWRDSDVEPWVAMNADPRVMEHFPSMYDRATAEASAARFRIALERDGYGWWPIEVKGGAAFAERHESEIVAITTPVNVRSQRVMQRLGMTHDPGDDFENPFIAEGHPLRTHVLYRLRAPRPS
jgi:RimJ/RimL family protein N-acetyltransferase